MLEFSVREEYLLMPEMVRPQLDFDLEKLQAFFFVNFLAVGNKRLIIHSRAIPKLHDDCEEAELVFDLSNSDVRAKNISNSLGVFPSDNSIVHNSWRACRLGESLLFTGQSGTAKLFSNFGQGGAIDVVIQNPLPNIKNTSGYSVNIRPNAWQRVMAQNSLIAMPITDGTKTRYLCFLDVDIDKHKAKWLLSSSSENSKAKNKTLSFWNKSQVEITHEKLLKTKADLTIFSPKTQIHAAIQNAMIKDGKIYIFTRGMHEQLHRKGGHAYSAIVQIDEKGNVLSTPFFQNHREHKDEKKRGVIGSFTSSKKYCTLQSIYTSTDEWNGKQRLFDMDSHVMEELKLPRGYSRYQLIDHFDGDFWFREPPKAGHEIETKVIRCEIV